MSTETTGTQVTLTRALVKVKLLDKRIHKAVSLPFITYQVGEKKRLDDDFKANLNSAQDLIQEREKIKNKIQEANQKATVTLDGEVFSIAEVLEKKQTMKYLEALANNIERQILDATYEIQSVNNDSQRRLDALLQANFGKDLKADSDDITKISDTFNASNEAKLYDPANAKTKLDDLRERIDNFMSEVDLLLSEANATNYIEV